MRAQPTAALAAGLVVLVCLAALPCSHGCAPCPRSTCKRTWPAWRGVPDPAVGSAGTHPAHNAHPARKLLDDNNWGDCSKWGDSSKWGNSESGSAAANCTFNNEKQKWYVWNSTANDWTETDKCANNQAGAARLPPAACALADVTSRLH